MTTLARLSFHVPAGRMDEFSEIYAEELAPLLARRDLVEAAERGRKTAAGFFSRLFELETSADVAARERVLRDDPEWMEMMQRLEEGFCESGSDGFPFYQFGPYQTTTGPGEIAELGAGIRQGLWLRFGSKDGLPLTAISDIQEDNQGNLWFATRKKGVYRYNGAQITHFTAKDGLASDVVMSTLGDREGNVWFGTGGRGVTRYDGREFVTYTAEDGLGDNWVGCILEDREGDLWFGTGNGGLSRHDGREFVTYTVDDGLATNTVYPLLEDQEGNLWFGTGLGKIGKGLSRYDGKGFSTFTVENGLPDNRIRSLLQGRHGHLWVGTGDGLSRYDGREFVTFAVESLPHPAVLAMVEDREGNLWFGCSNVGVSRYDSREFTTFTIADGLVHDLVHSLLEDRQGNLWIGTEVGICRYDQAQWATFTASEGLDTSACWPLLEDHRGTLWVGNLKGLSRYDGTRFVPLDLLAGQGVWSLLEDRRGILWIGTVAGLYRYDGKDVQIFTTADGLATPVIRCLLEDSRGNLWVSTAYQGVSRYDGREFVNFTTADGLSFDRIWCMFEDSRGDVWFGTQGGGACRYDGQRFETVIAADSVPLGEVTCIMEDRQGAMWFGTVEGVIRYREGESVTFTTADGLSHNQVTGMLEDRAGHLWFGTCGGGATCYDGKVFLHLTRQDGLVYDVVQEFVQDRQGDFWFTSNAGLTRYRPQSIPPTVRIVEVVADQRHGSVEEIDLPASQKFVTFAFQGQSFSTSPERMAYVYRLREKDEDWVSTYRREATYHDLELGEYTFEVRAVDRDLNYSEPAVVRVQVAPDPHIEALTQALSTGGPSGEFVGESPAMEQMLAQLREVAPSELTVLVLGETGTGKGLAARFLHQFSGRNSGPFIQVNCGSIPAGLVESELFGHEKGAFTGAFSRKVGKVELATGGTLFLDEIGDLPPEAQVKLLRLLEEGAFERVGGTETLQATARIVAATNRDLQQMVGDGNFRADLYFRLMGFEVRLPPLRERREDIPLLANYFVARMANHLHKEIVQLAADALVKLKTHDWPGNVRELEHVLNRAVIVCPAGEEIRAEHLNLGQIESETVREYVTLEEHERRYIREVLEQTDWAVKGANGTAAILGLPASTLYSRMKKLGIKRS